MKKAVISGAIVLCALVSLLFAQQSSLTIPGVPGSLLNPKQLTNNNGVISLLSALRVTNIIVLDTNGTDALSIGSVDGNAFWDPTFGINTDARPINVGSIICTWLTPNGPVTNISNVETRGNQTNAQRLDVTGDMGTWGAITNRGYIRNQNNVTNDLTVFVGGNLIVNNATASRLVALDSGKVVITPGMSSGQLFIGTGSGGYALGTLTPRNGVVVDNANGTITIGLGSSGLVTNFISFATAGSSSSIPLIAKGDSTTTTNLFEVQKSTGQIVASVDSNGLFQAQSATVAGLGTFMGGAVATNSATTNVTLKIVGMSAGVTNIFEVWSNGVLQVTISSNGIITFPSSNPAQVYKDSTDNLQLVAAIGSGKIVYVGDANAASYGIAVGSSSTRIKSGILALGGANDTNNIRLKQIQAGTTTLPNVLGIQDAAGGAAGCLLEFRAVPDSRTNNAPSTDSARIGAFLDSGGVAQLFVKAEDGTTKQITEHAITDAPASIIDAWDDMPNISVEIQPYLGKVRWINKSRLAFLTQSNILGVSLALVPTAARTCVLTETFAQYNTRLNLTNGNALVLRKWTNDSIKPIPTWLSSRGAQ